MESGSTSSVALKARHAGLYPGQVQYHIIIMVVGGFPMVTAQVAGGHGQVFFFAFD